MGEVHPLSELRREFIADGDHSALRATWHRESGFVVVSLWRGDTCVGTSHLTPKEAGRLATFITGGLADLATEWHGLTRQPAKDLSGPRSLAGCRGLCVGGGPAPLNPLNRSPEPFVAGRSLPSRQAKTQQPSARSAADLVRSQIWAIPSQSC